MGCKDVVFAGGRAFREAGRVADHRPMFACGRYRDYIPAWPLNDGQRYGRDYVVH